VGFHYRRPATRGGRAARDLGRECGEVAGGVEVAIEHEAALVASECPFGQAQCGFTTPQAEQVVEDGYQRSARCTVLPAHPVLYSI
jgi:hypothetical protein